MRTAILQPLVLSASVLVSCSDSTPPEPRFGSLQVNVSTTGKDQDFDGYVVILDDLTGHEISSGGQTVIRNLEPGVHQVRLAGVAPNCDPHPLTALLEFVIEPGEMTAVSYIVTCFGTGVVIQSTAEGLDRGEYYSVVLDGRLRHEVVRPGSSLEITSLSPGTHEIRLEGLPANCGVSPERHMVSVELRTVRVVEFVTRCTAAYGLLMVRAVTTGHDLDLGGFLVTIDGEPSFPVPTNGEGAGLVDPGILDLRLESVAPNCAVLDGDLRAVTVTAGGLARDTTRMTVEVACQRSWAVAFVRRDAVALATDDGSMVDIGPTGTHPQWSPDGTLLAWQCYPICVTRLDTGETVVFSSNLLLSAPAWKPDGSRIAYVVSECSYWYYYDDYCEFEGLFHVAATGSNPVRIPLSGYVVDANDLSWSPDGSTIAFACRPMANDGWTLCLVEPEGGDLRRVFATAGNDVHPSWSPDGTRLVFSTSRFGNPEIATVRADGTDLRRFDPPVPGLTPTWAPDGRILYATGEGIRAMNADGSNRIALTTVAGDSLPTVRPRP